MEKDALRQLTCRKDVFAFTEWILIQKGVSKRFCSKTPLPYNRNSTPIRGTLSTRIVQIFQNFAKEPKIYRFRKMIL